MKYNKFILGLLIGAIFTLGVVLVVNLTRRISMGGSTADDWNVGGNLGVTGTSTLTGATTIAANLNADGGLIERGLYDYGEEPSISMTSTIFCDYRGAMADFDGYDSDTVASITMPSDEDLIADCLANEGYKRFTFDGTSSTSTVVYEFVTTGLVWNAASSSACDMIANNGEEITSDEIVVLEAYYDGVGSVSWTCDAFTSSTSFQP